MVSLMLLYKFAHSLVEFLWLFPEQHMAGILEEYGFGARDVFTYPGAAVPVKDIAVTRYAYQGGQFDLGNEIPPVKVRVVPHNFNPYIGRAF